jgi:hypothetical protein
MAKDDNSLHLFDCFLPCADIESTPAYLIKSAVKGFIVRAPTCQHEWNYFEDTILRSVFMSNSHITGVFNIVFLCPITFTCTFAG